MKSDSASFYAQSPARPFLDSLFGIRQASLLFHTLTLRIAKPDGKSHFSKPSLTHLPANLIIYQITVFLDCKHIARRLQCLNTSMVSLEKQIGQNVFWHKVFMARPPHKNPGFQIDKVDWRKLLLKKDQGKQ